MAFMSALKIQDGIFSRKEPTVFYKIVILLLILVTLLSPSTALRDHRKLSKNVTKLLDNLLATNRYDKRIRPDFGGSAVSITVNMYIKSIGPVSETDEWYSMDCYFRQSWYDRRLRFNLTGLDEFSMNWLFLERVWKPDTYFMNGKKSYLHRITVPNKFLRIRSDGLLTYSMRLTIKASCKMHLRKFPFDSQICPLLIGSYGYSGTDVQYKWHGPSPIGLEPGVNLAQYDLVNITTESEAPTEMATVRRDRRKHEDFSVIKMNFHLKRNTGYFMLQIYVPCGLIVSCSWVSFWIDPDAVPARVSLGVTTVLSMTTMGFGGRSQLPKVSYRTALDWFVILCFSFVFAVMIEYAAINFIDTLTADIKKILEERKKAAAEREKETVLLLPGTSDTEEETEFLKSPNVDEQEAFGAPCGLEAIDCSIQDSQEALTPNTEEPEDIGLVKPALVTVTLATAVAVATMAGANQEDERRPDSQGSGPESQGSCSHKSSTSSSSHGKNNWVENSPGIPTIVIESAIDLEDYDAEFEEEDTPLPPKRGVATSTWLFECASAPVRKWRAIRLLPREEDVSLTEEKEKFSIIDRQSRKVFPFCFCLMLSIYWFLYMYYITDEVAHSPNAEKKHLNTQVAS